MLYAALLGKYLSLYSYVLRRFAAYVFAKNHNANGSFCFQWDDDIVENILNMLGGKTKERVA